MAKAKDTPAVDPQATADTDTVSSPQPQQPPTSGGGADPGLGTAGPQEDNPTEMPPGYQCVKLSGGWNNPDTGVEHEAGEWVVVPDQTAYDLNTAGYLVRNSDGTPLTAAQAADDAKAQRAAAGGEESRGDEGRAAGDTGEETSGDKAYHHKGKTHSKGDSRE